MAPSGVRGCLVQQWVPSILTQSPDYVYAAAAWEKRDPVPYSIGRIIEFIPPDVSASQWPPARNAEEERRRQHGLRVRVAWFYRPTDVQDKGIGDHRVLLAALFSEIIPFINVRGKCIVRHRDKIVDLAAYKKKDDRFYFHQLFDPFTKEHYEVILATDVHNRESITTLKSLFDQTSISP
jgi:BAH domain